LDEISFKYKNSEYLSLDNISLELKKGESIGVVGQTGSGKSTFIDALMGLLPIKEGKIVLDGTPINQSNIIEYRKLFSHVPQKIFILDATLLDNIIYGCDPRNIDFDRLWMVIEAAQLNDFVKRLPKGLYSYLGEGGSLISGGERQRIGIARSLYRKCEILILDEATSALDLNTEKLVIGNLKAFASDLTLIMVAHRLSTLESTDRIIDIEAGKIVGIKNFYELKQ